MTRGKGRPPVDLSLPAPWIAHADMPAIADRTAVQMKKGGATAVEIRIVWEIIRAHVVISDQYWKDQPRRMARARIDDARKRINSSTVTVRKRRDKDGNLIGAFPRVPLLDDERARLQKAYKELTKAEPTLNDFKRREKVGERVLPRFCGHFHQGSY